MKDMKPNRNSYTALEFREWKTSKALILTPRFQRRGVWTTPKKSFLIDTILRGLPIPPIYLRLGQNEKKTRTIREVIDGQQRISAVVDFLNDDFPLSRSLDPGYAGKKFSGLSDDQKDQVTGYAFNCETFAGIDDSTVLEIFTRMNTYSVQLNPQELRNGKYFGVFKQLSYSLAREYLSFWRENRIFSEQGIARMNEVELVSELLIAQIDGMQDKKNTLDDFYKKYDEKMSNRKEVRQRFESTIDEISEAMDGLLGELEWKRRPLFYSLFCAVYHRMYGLPGIVRHGRKLKALSSRHREDLYNATVDLSDVLARAKDNQKFPRRHATFVAASQRQTDNIKPRTIRFAQLYTQAFG